MLPERVAPAEQLPGGERAFRAVLDAERRRGGGGVDGFIGRKAAELAAAAERAERQWERAEEEPARQRRVEVAFVACAFGQSPGEAFSVRAAAELAADNTTDRVRARFDVDAQWCLVARKTTWFRSALCRHAPSRGGLVPRRARHEVGPG